MKTRTLIKILATLAFASTLTLTGCGEDKTPKLRVGATAGPHAANVQKAAEVAKKDGLKVQVVEFTDYVTPNKALEEKALDLNVYQHEPFLNNFNQQNGTHLKKVANAVVQPMGFYSDVVKELDKIPDDSFVSIPNDPTNAGRALLLLQKAGLIKLKEGVDGNTATIADIAENPKHLIIKELEAAQLPRSLEDVEMAVIPMNYVISSGISPKEKGFYFESKDAPYALMVIASREDNANDENVKKFIKAFQSPEVKKFIEEEFKGAVQAAW